MAKTSSGSKIGKGIVIGVLIAAIGIGGACALGYASRNDEGKWFEGLHWNNSVQTDNAGNASEGNVIVSDVGGNGLELCSSVVSEEDYAAYGISPQSVENVFELSVTYVPENTTFQETNYTIAFKNPDSEWARGKVITDYAELTHEAGSKNAALAIKQGFGEQIIATAVSERDSTISATFTVDYLNEYVSFEYSDGNYGEDASMSNWKFSTGTIYNTLRNGLPNCEDNNDWFVDIVFDFQPVINAVKRCGYENVITVPKYYEYKVTCHDVYENNGLLDAYDVCKRACNITAANEKQFNVALISISEEEVTATLNGRSLALVNFILNRTYNGVDYGTHTVADIETDETLKYGWVDIWTYGLDELAVRATGMTANNSHLIAG